MSVPPLPDSHRPSLRAARRAGKRSKTALILAGGGVTGAVYEMGVLQALNQYLGNDFSLYDFDMVIGLSAGSLVGSFLANGVTPQAMMGALHEQPDAVVTPISKWDVFRPNIGEFLQRAAALPHTLLNNIFKQLRKRQFNGNPYVGLFDEILPSALFTNHRIEHYVRHNLHFPGRSNDFRRLKKPFYVVATELDTGDRMVFGDVDHDHVPISKAVQASTAIPLFYKPVRIGRREYVDGAIRKTLHVDIAIEKGAELIICVNPVVPLRNDVEKEFIPLLDHRGRYISEKGFGYVWWQTLRLLMHSRIPLSLENYKRNYPNVDIIIIEPRPNDYRMFFHSIMDYEARIPIARHGYKTTMSALSHHFDEYAAKCARHGITFRRPTEHHAFCTLTPDLPDTLAERMRQIGDPNAERPDLKTLRDVLRRIEESLSDVESPHPPRRRAVKPLRLAV
jgi:NTE family protein